MLKCLFGVFNFLKTTNENKSYSSEIEFVCSCFGGNVSLKKSFCLTFKGNEKKTCTWNENTHSQRNSPQCEQLKMKGHFHLLFLHFLKKWQRRLEMKMLIHKEIHPNLSSQKGRRIGRGNECWWIGTITNPSFKKSPKFVSLVFSPIQCAKHRLSKINRWFFFIFMNSI